MTNEFDEYSEGSAMIKLGNKEVKIIPTMQEAFLFQPLINRILRDADEKAVEKLCNMTVEMIKRAYPNESVDNIKKMVALNSSELATEILIGLKFIKREDLEEKETKKKI